jgi:hypothetical protein
VPSKEERAGAHRNGGSIMRQHKRCRAAVFNSGGVAPVVVDVCGGVLQHRCGRGKRDLAPIWERRSSKGRSLERGKTAEALGKIRHEGEASGGRRQRFGHGNGGEGGGAREGAAGAGSVMREWTSGLVTFERLGQRCGREGKRRGERGGGGLAVGVPCGAGHVGPGSNRRAASRPRPGHGVPLLWQWHADAADAWAPVVGGRGSEKREARRAWAGLGRKKRVGRTQLNSMILDLFKLIQMGSK